MCIALIAYKYHPDYPLIILSNRDEFWKRPTLLAHFWSEYPYILGGKDMEQGGTWFGVSKKGKIALLTNFRAPTEQDPKKKSRGSLVVDFLKQDISLSNYLNKLQHTAKVYNGYNLIFGTFDRLCFYNNVKNITSILTPGVHVLSNGVLNEMWPKCKRLKELFLESIPISSNISINSLFNILKDTKQFPDKELPDTGIGIYKERLLSPIFIKNSSYGTRTSSILMIDNLRTWKFIESTYFPGSSRVEQQREFCFFMP